MFTQLPLRFFYSSRFRRNSNRDVIFEGRGTIFRRLVNKDLKSDSQEWSNQMIFQNYEILQKLNLIIYEPVIKKHFP